MVEGTALFMSEKTCSMAGPVPVISWNRSRWTRSRWRTETSCLRRASESATRW